MAELSLSPEMAESMRAEYLGIKETLDSQAGKRSEAKAGVINSIRENADSEPVTSFTDVITTMLTEKFGTDANADYVMLRDAMADVIQYVDNQAENYIARKLAETVKSVSGNSDELRIRAKEIRERFDLLAGALKQFGGVEIDPLPKLGSGGRPAGSGKHQKASATISFAVDDKPLVSTRLNDVLLSNSQNSGGKGSNGSYQVREFLDLLKANNLVTQSEYDNSWSFKMGNGKTLSLTRKEAEVSEDAE